MFAIKKNFYHQNIFTIKKIVAVIEIFTVNNFFLNYNLIILKKIVIMAGIFNHTIVDCIEGQLVMMLKKNLLTFFFPIMLQDL